MIYNAITKLPEKYRILAHFLAKQILSDYVEGFEMNDITLKIYQFIEDKLGVERSAIKDSASFYNDLDVDSLDFCELIVDVEKEFDIQIPDDTYEKLKTVGSLVNYVARAKHSDLPKIAEMASLGEEERLSA